MPMATAGPLQLVAAAAIGIVVLGVLIVVRKVPAFVALLVASLAIALVAQFPDLDARSILQSMQDGMAGTLGFVAVVVGLGAMFGQLLEVSGGAEVLATRMLAGFGERRASWAMGLAGFVIAIPVFFDVGFVLLVPLLHGLARRTGKPLLAFAAPALAGLAVAHAFVPPTPGPMAVASLLDAPIGLVIVFGVAAGLPAMIVAGPLFGRFAAARIPGVLVEAPDAPEMREDPPSLATVAGLLALPIVLILGHTWALAAIAGRDEVAPLLEVVILVGHPFVALLVTTLACFRLLGTRRGWSRERVHDLATKALEPAGIVILVTGAGGVLKQVLIDTQVGRALAEPLAASDVSPIVLAFVLAATVRVLQGSATVAMLTAAGLLVPLLEPVQPSPHLRALLVVAIASGATVGSHVNDSGFWLVSRYLGLDVGQTLRSWTVLTTILGCVGGAVALLLGALS